MNVLQTEAPTGQIYELQTTTQGTLLAEVVPGGGGGSTIVTPLENIFWILQSSTDGGGAAVETDAPSGAFSTFAAALAAATPGVDATLFVGEGDYSAEGAQDWAGKGIPSLNVICLDGVQGTTLPPLNCDLLRIENGIVLDPGGGAPSLLAVGGCDLYTTNVLGPIQTGNLAADRCVVAGGTIGGGTLFNCNFVGPPQFSALSSLEVDANTLAALGEVNASTTEVDPHIFGGGFDYAWMKDANKAFALSDFPRLLVPANVFTAARVATVDLTSSTDLDTLTVDGYGDLSVNTLTVNGVVLDGQGKRYVLQVQTGALVLISRENVPANQGTG
jgi:hypothetical protein